MFKKTFILFLVLSAGCGTQQKQQLEKIPEDPNMIVGIPTEVIQKFEVREEGQSEATPHVKLTPLPAVDASKVKVDSKISKKSKKDLGKGPAKGSVPDSYNDSGIKESQLAQFEGQKFQFPNVAPQREPIWIGEKLTYEVSYMGVPGGSFTMEVLPQKIINDRKVFHIKGKAESNWAMSKFYRINDMLETFFDVQGRFSHRFHLVLDESKQTRDSLELYDSEKRQVYYWDRWNHHKRGYEEKKETRPMLPFSQDSVSSLFYVRGLELPDGKVFNFNVITEGKTWDLEVKVVRRETLTTPIGKMRTIVLKPETKFQGVMKQAGDSYMWLSDDDRKIMVRMEAKVKIGSVVAQIKEFVKGTPP